MKSGLGRDFWKLWLAVCGSNLSFGIRVAAMPLLATTMTTDSFAIGAVAAAAWLPWLLFSIPVGGYVDRHDRRAIMRNVQLVRLVLVVGLITMVLIGGLGIAILVFLAFALGALDVVYDTTAEALLPSFVRDEQLVSANGRIFFAELASNRLIGPLVGSVVFVVHPAAPFLADATLLVVAACGLQSLPSRGLPTADSTKRGLFSDVAETIRWLAGHPVLRGLSVSAAVLNLALGATSAMMVILAVRELGAGSVGYGMLLAGSAVGGLIGSATVGKVGRRLGSRRAIIATMVLSSAIFALLGAAPALWAACLLMVASGFCGSTGNILVRSLRQSLASDNVRGRVSAGFRFVAYSTLPLGSLLGGLLVAAVGVRYTFVVAGAVVALAAAAVARALIRSQGTVQHEAPDEPRKR